MHWLSFVLLMFPLVMRAQLITTVAGTGNWGCSGDGGPANQAEFKQPLSIAVDDRGGIYIVDIGNDDIRKVSADGHVVTLVGAHEGHVYDPGTDYNGDGGPATNAVMWKPRSIVAAERGVFFFGDFENSVIRRVHEGEISSVAGFPQRPAGSDGAGNVSSKSPAGSKRAGYTIGLPLFFADEHNHQVHRIDIDGSVSCIAGTGVAGYSGDGGPATDAALNKPWVAISDDEGNLFISDTYNNVVRKIDRTGTIMTYAGCGLAGCTGDGGAATAARIAAPHGIALDHSGNLYVTDVVNNVVRVIDPKGVIRTFAGNGVRGYSGDNGAATSARLNWPSDVAVDADGNVYIADDQNHVVRKVSPQRRESLVPPVHDAFRIEADAASGLLRVHTDSGAFQSFTIADLSGKVFISHMIYEELTTVDISALAPGRYYIKLEHGSLVKTAMFVKDK